MQMLLIKTPHLTIVTKYFYNNKGRPYYQRRIPNELQKYFSNARNIQRRLTGKLSSMSEEIARYAAEDTQRFAQLRAGIEGSFTEQALLVLAQHGLEPLDGLAHSRVPAGMYDQPHLNDIEHYLQVREQAGTLTEADLLAKKLLIAPLPVMLSDAPSIYFKHHDKGNDAAFIESTRRTFDMLIDLVGDMPLQSINRSHARKFVEHRLKEVKTGSILRNINTIRAVLTKAIVESGINVANPFVRLNVPNSGKDVSIREGFTVPETKQMIDACTVKSDQMRVILLVCIFTGCRIAEAVGLRWQDVDLENDIPTVSFVEYEGRSLKTSNSARTVPIMPPLVQVLTKLKPTDSTGKAVFPKYNKDETVSGDKASAALSKWIRAQGINKTPHNARHTLRDLLRNSGCTEALCDQIGGWAKQNVGQRYGQGYSLAVRNDALVRAFKTNGLI
jgi:integrase